MKKTIENSTPIGPGQCYYVVLDPQDFEIKIFEEDEVLEVGQGAPRHLSFDDEEDLLLWDLWIRVKNTEVGGGEETFPIIQYHIFYGPEG